MNDPVTERPPHWEHWGLLYLIARGVWMGFLVGLLAWLLAGKILPAELMIERLAPGEQHALLDAPLYEVERISDINRDGFAWADGITTEGLVNGYSTYSNQRGGWIVATSTRPAQGMLYRDEAGEVFPVRKLPLGESNTVRLISDNADASIDHTYPFTWLKKVNLNSGAELAKQVFSYNVEVEHHATFDVAGRYQPAWINNRNSVQIWDWQTGAIAGTLNTRFAAYEISPSGRWLRTGRSPDKYGNGGMNRFWRLPEMLEYVDCLSVTQDHSAWAWDTQGREVFVSKDSSRDYFYYFCPDAPGETNTRPGNRMFSHDDLAWTNHHIAGIPNPGLRGWTLISTYSQQNRWSDNQLLLVELVEKPRVIRLGNHGTRWGMSRDKTKDYFCEAWASVDFEGRFVYWGSNAGGTRNLELVRMEIPRAARVLMGWEAAPEPTPTATPTPEPTPDWQPLMWRRNEAGAIEFRLE